MIFTIFRHQVISFFRSRNTKRRIILNVFLGLMMFFFLALAIFIGASTKLILKEIFPNEDIVKVFCGFILYYFSFDIIIRFMLQELPILTIQPYLVQNIKKRILINFLNTRSLFTIFNVLPLILFVPFTATVIWTKYGTNVSAAFIVLFISLSLGNHFLVLFIKRKTLISSLWMVSVFFIIALFILFEKFSFFSVAYTSTKLFWGLLSYPLFVIFAIIYAYLSFINNYSYLSKNIYLEENLVTSTVARRTNYKWLKQFGLIGELIGVEIKMIIRNKRPRSLLTLSGLSLFYGFLFFKPEFFENEKLDFVVFGTVLISGGGIMNYGQFLLSWQTNNFDGMMTRNIGLKTYFRSKIMMMICMSTITLIVSFFYGFINWKIIPIEIAAYLFNIGIQAVVICFFSTLNYKAIDLGKNSSFNYQGIGAIQWLQSVVSAFGAFIFYYSFALLFNSLVGIILLAAAGLISLLLYNFWIDLIVEQFEKRKYKIIAGFREK